MLIIQIEVSSQESKSDTAHPFAEFTPHLLLNYDNDMGTSFKCRRSNNKIWGTSHYFWPWVGQKLSVVILGKGRARGRRKPKF